MAGKSIEFTISAVDKATKTVAKVNRNIDRMMRPYQNLAKSAKRFSEASGLTKVSKNLGNVAKEAEKAARSITKMAAPLLAIVGGGTIAGLSGMVTQWERIGAETERTSRMLGITANQLTQMRSAATLMGVSSETMTSGFQALQDTLQDARWGRNQGAFGTLQALGIRLHTTKTGAIDTQAAMYDLADRMQRIQQRDPAAARNLARNLGVEQLLPVLVQGRAAMQRYEAEAKRLRGDFTPGMATRAQAFTQSVTGLGIAFDGLKASISDKLAPILGPIIDRFANWIAVNRNLISQKVADMVTRIAGAFERIATGVNWDVLLKDIGDTADAISCFVVWLLKAVDAMGGVKGVATAFALYMAGGFIGSIAASIGSIIGLGTRVWGLIKLWRGASAAAAAAGEAMTAAGTAAEGAAGAAAGAGGAATAGGGAAAAAGGGLLSRMFSFLTNPLTVGAGLMAYSPDLGTGEADTLRRIRAAEAAAGGVYPGSPTFQPTDAAPGGAAAVASMQDWSDKLGFGFLEKRYNLPPGLLAGLGQVESGGNAYAMSKAGAQGLFQFMPATAKEYGINPLDPAQSATAAARKLSGLMQRYHGNLSMALSAYNWGEGNLDRKGLANAPAETLAYAPKVMAAMSNYGGGMDSGQAMPALNTPPAPMATTAPPVVHVSNDIHVSRDGSTSIRTQTPTGLHVEHAMPEAA